MSFNTYVINLKKDIKKWTKIQKNLKNVNITPIRFDAIDGNNIPEKYKIYLSMFCQGLCPNSVKGCSLSHLLVSKQFLDTDKKNNYCLILEDDAIPIVNNLKEEINKLVTLYDNWDIIRLYGMGYCPNIQNGPLQKVCSGSNVAYLLSKNGARKLQNLKINWYYDIQLNLINTINLYIHKPFLFRTYYSESSNTTDNINWGILDQKKLGNVPISYWLKVKLLKIPYIEYNINVIMLFIILFLMQYIIFY